MRWHWICQNLYLEANILSFYSLSPLTNNGNSGIISRGSKTMAETSKNMSFKMGKKSPLRCTLLRTAISLYASEKPGVTNLDLILYTLKQPTNGTVIHLLDKQNYWSINTMTTFQEDKRNVMKIKWVRSYFPNIKYCARRLVRRKMEYYLCVESLG